MGNLIPTAQDLVHLAQWIFWTLVVGLPLLACVGLGSWVMAGLQNWWAGTPEPVRPAHWNRSLEDWGDLSDEDRGLADAIASLRPTHPTITRGPVVDIAARRSVMDARIAERRRKIDLLLQPVDRQVH